MNNQPNYDMAMGFLQVFDVLLNLNQVSNDTLLEELQRQNKEYLEKIVKQNEEIIEQNNVLETKLNSIWEQMGESTEEILRRVDNGSQQRLP